MWTYIFIFFGINDPGIQLLCPLILVCLLLEETTEQSYRVSAPFCIPTSSFSTSSPVFVIVAIFYFSYSDRYVGELHWDFNLLFSNGYWYWTSLYVLICHLYELDSIMSFHIFCPFSIWIVVVCLPTIECGDSLYILDTSPLFGYVAYKFFFSSGYSILCFLFILFRGYFVEQNFEEINFDDPIYLYLLGFILYMSSKSQPWGQSSCLFFLTLPLGETLLV